MNTNVIEKAMTCYLTMTSISDEERMQAINVLKELAATDEAMQDGDTWDSDVVLVPTDAWINILNYTTYDIMGKRMRQHETRVPLEYYVHDVRADIPGMDSVAKCYLKYGYEVLHDLWLENEEQHSNDYDGTFKCASNRLKDKVVAADFSCAELGAIAGCIQYAMSNPECSLAWAFNEPENKDDEKWMLDVLEVCCKKLDAVNKHTSVERECVFTVEGTDEDTIYGSNK